MRGLEGLRLGEPKEFWALLKPARKPLLIAPEVLHQHYQQLFQPKQEHSAATIRQGEQNTRGQAITADEVAAAVSRIRSNKAMGASWVTPELLKSHRHGGLYAAMATMFNTACT